jgi:hypothetical protein
MFIETISELLASFGRRRMISREQDGLEQDYLERFYILSTKYFGIYLHRFWISDDDGLHSHPWNSISILLKGSYFEEEPINQNDPFGPTKVSKRSPLHPPFKIRPKHYTHRITVPSGTEGKCWSLFIRFGLKRQVWGFYRNGKFEPAEVQSRKDLKENAETFAM